MSSFPAVQARCRPTRGRAAAGWGGGSARGARGVPGAREVRRRSSARAPRVLRAPSRIASDFGPATAVLCGSADCGSGRPLAGRRRVPAGLGLLGGVLGWCWHQEPRSERPVSAPRPTCEGVCRDSPIREKIYIRRDQYLGVIKSYDKIFCGSDMPERCTFTWQRQILLPRSGKNHHKTP